MSPEAVLVTSNGDLDFFVVLGVDLVDVDEAFGPWPRNSIFAVCEKDVFFSQWFLDLRVDSFNYGSTTWVGFSEKYTRYILVLMSKSIALSMESSCAPGNLGRFWGLQVGLKGIDREENVELVNGVDCYNKISTETVGYFYREGKDWESLRPIKEVKDKVFTSFFEMIIGVGYYAFVKDNEEDVSVGLDRGWLSLDCGLQGILVEVKLANIGVAHQVFDDMIDSTELFADSIMSLIGKIIEYDLNADLCLLCLSCVFNFKETKKIINTVVERMEPKEGKGTFTSLNHASDSALVSWTERGLTVSQYSTLLVIVISVGLRVCSLPRNIWVSTSASSWYHAMKLMSARCLIYWVQGEGSGCSIQWRRSIVGFLKENSIVCCFAIYLGTLCFTELSKCVHPEICQVTQWHRRSVRWLAFLKANVVASSCYWRVSSENILRLICIVNGTTDSAVISGLRVAITDGDNVLEGSKCGCVSRGTGCFFSISTRSASNNRLRECLGDDGLHL